MTDASLLPLFRMEAEAQTRALTDGLLLLEREPTLATELESCMRAAHSLKGAARIVGLEEGVRIAHVMEDCLVAAQSGELRLNAKFIDVLLQGVDLLQRLAPAEGGEGPSEPELVTFIERLSALMSGDFAEIVSAEPPAEGGGSPEEVGVSTPEESIDAIVAPPTQSLAPTEPEFQATVGDREGNEAPEAGPEPDSAAVQVPDTATTPIGSAFEQAGGERVLRVTAGHLNQLLDLSSKALVESQRFQPLCLSATRLKRQHSTVLRILADVLASVRESGIDDNLVEQCAEALRVAESSHQNLIEHVMDLDEFGWESSQRARYLYDTALACRMRPFSDISSGYARMVRDLGRELGKRVRLVVEGEHTQVDRDVLEQLDAPLSHLLRNAIDHGIELPEQRVAAGKPEEGRIILRAGHQAGLLQLELDDDGSGVDVVGLRKRIVERKLVSAETAPHLSMAELLAFLFLPGFTLREQVTEVSGRGVGLDAVQHVMRNLRGNVRVTTRPGGGTRFSLQVPLTLSVVRSLVVEIGSEVYAFPLAHIERMVTVEADDIAMLDGRQHLWYDDQHICLVAGSQILQCTPGESDSGGIPVVIVRDEDVLYGITVERFIGERTLNVMPLDPRLGKVADVAAGALLDDGRPLLILDVEDMLRSIDKLLNSGRIGRVDALSRRAGARSNKRVLVVDDSLTVRELQRKLLQHRGYDVAVAVDGMDGWNALRSEHFDLLISDIDMPRMDGIELVRLVRRDKRLSALPVMVVSYKDREEDRQRGLEAGADYYLTKASFHDEALLDAVVTLIGTAEGV